LSEIIDVSKRISESGVVPVIQIDDSSKAVALADALLEAELPLVEITLRTESALESLRQISLRRPEMLAGAGTVLSETEAIRAIDSGSKFLVSPGLDLELLKLSKAKSMVFIPGFMTPSELAAALKHGCRMAKFYPASAAGGPSALSSIIAPFLHRNPDIMPTGGINLRNMKSWLETPRVLAVGGTWLATRADIAGGNWAEITRKARDAVALARETLDRS